MNLKNKFLILIIVGVVSVLIIIRNSLFPTQVQAQSVEFQSGEVFLRGTIYGPIQPILKNKPPIVFCHGNRALGYQHPLYQALINYLAQERMVFAFNFRGYGNSSKYSGFKNGFSMNFSDQVLSATKYLEQFTQMPMRNFLLLGHSLGGTQLLLAASREQFNSVVAIGTYQSDVFFREPKSMDFQIKKISKLLGVDVPSEYFKDVFPKLNEMDIKSIREKGTSVNFIYGALEPREAWFGQNVYEIYGADHMFSTENGAGFKSRIQIFFLAKKIGRLSS